MKKNLLKSVLLALMVLVGGNAWAGDKTVVKYSFDDATSPSLTAGSRVSLDYTRTSVISSTKFLNAWNNTNGDPGASTVSLGNTDLSGETWTLSFEWAACGGCNSKADHTTLKAGDTNLFDLTGNSNWNTTVTITYAGSDGTKTLPVPGCDKNKRFKADVGDQLNTTAYWHHIVVTGSASGVKMTITNSSTGTAVVEDVLLSETNVNPTSLIIEPCCGGAIGIDELSLTYYVEGEVIQTPTANYTAVNGIERTITATCETEDATLYYSTDGENWTEGSSITVSASGNVYFKAVKGNSESEVLTFAAVAGEAITLNAPSIVRSDNATVTISADQTALLLSPNATIYYEYGSESGSFTGSKVLTVEADATITAYAEATGYTTSATSERAVALFPKYVKTIENTPTKTSGTTTFALSTETITVSEREYAALLLDDVQWGTNVYLQNLTLSDPIVWGIRNGNWYINTTDNQWILIRNLKAGDIVVANVTYPAAETVNATYSEKYTFANNHAYIVTADGDVELAFRKINAKDMDYFYGIYAYSPMNEEEIAAAEALAAAKAELQTAIDEAKAIDTTEKEGVDELNAAIAAAEAALANAEATVETLAAAKAALAEAVAAFEAANAVDPTTLIANADFEGEYTVYSNPKEDRAIYQPAGWTLAYEGGEANDMTALNSECLAWDSFSGRPQLGEAGGNNSYWVRFRWGNAETLTLSQTITVPAGEWKLSADAFFNGADGATAKIFAGENNTNITGNSTWAKHAVTFVSDGETPVTIGFNLTQTVQAENIAAVDNFTLETFDPLADAKATLQAEIATAEALIENATYADGKDELNAAIAAANTALTEATTAEALAEAVETLKSAEAAFNKAQAIAANAALVAGATVDNPVAAPFVVNGTFDTKGVVTPWKATGGFQNQTTANNQSGAFGIVNSYFYENWNGSAKENKMYQTIENIPNGVYKLNIAAFVNTLANPNESQYVFANSDKEYLTTGEPTMYEVFTKVEGNSMEIGLEQTTATANWMGIDNISLTYYGADATIEAAKNSAFLKEAAEVLAAKQSVKTKTALQAAYDAFVAESSDENKAALEAALAAAKASVNSYKILEAGVLPDNSLAGWTCTTFVEGQDVRWQVNTWSNEGNSDGTGMVTPFLENWTPKAYVLGVGEIYYSLPGLDPGIYSFSALIRAYSEAGNAPTGASLFAGDREKEFATGKSVTYNNGALIGIYDNYAMTCEVGEEGVFRFGIKVAEERNFNWMAFKNCKVAYVGGAIDEAAIDELAATMPEGKMNAEIRTAAEAALAAAKENINLDNYEAATKAVADAQASAAAYTAAAAKLANMKQVTTETNVYTSEALENYYGQWVVKYEDETLTSEEANGLQDPFLVTGWHAAVTVDNFLLSAWDTNPDFVEAPYYINTWSTEGGNDGSNFVVPFFEYWTGDGNSLGEKTLTATMNDLDVGNVYDVSALVRVRMKNDAEAPAYGITFQANDSTAVDACNGDQVGTSQLYMKEVKTISGKVGADGTLKIQFKVAADNNISWLSFKNVKFVYNPDATGINDLKQTNVLEGTIYNLNGQKVNKAQKGLFIINGKKVVVK